MQNREERKRRTTNNDDFQNVLGFIFVIYKLLRQLQRTELTGYSF